MKTLDEAVKKMRDDLDKFLTKKQMGDYAEHIAKQISKRTRLGFGVPNNNEKQFKFNSNPKTKLSPKYIKHRERHKNELYKDNSSPSKSNLTYTGELLNNIMGKGVSDGFALIYAYGKRNKDITGWQEDKGRIFLRMSKTEINEFTRQIAQDFEQYIKKSLS